MPEPKSEIKNDYSSHVSKKLEILKYEKIF